MIRRYISVLTLVLLSSSQVYANSDTVVINSKKVTKDFNYVAEQLKDAMLRYSDYRLKTNVLPLQNSLDKLTTINGVSYNYDIPMSEEHNALIQSLLVSDQQNCSAKFNKLAQIQSEQLGVVAQDVQAVFPELVSNKCGYLQVDYIALIPVMIEAIKELKQEVNDLKHERQM
ncbi:tail fiber domain-containing protein [Zooshikella harenae]|uniref:Tail fiber domain-containing protein n=1 Tax=Zooshikella harenae TaxID=2827238 RepID=A0ABS5ZL38_9GAMM|nr:tail fiber domain-containing protein [Zooshikella harenae]MBU2714060.1 tail fiber domain-containing protein [Zooshikella harenae]